jgi:hypothetical protein
VVLKYGRRSAGQGISRRFAMAGEVLAVMQTGDINDDRYIVDANGEVFSTRELERRAPRPWPRRSPKIARPKRRTSNWNRGRSAGWKAHVERPFGESVASKRARTTQLRPALRRFDRPQRSSLLPRSLDRR